MYPTDYELHPHDVFSKGFMLSRSMNRNIGYPIECVPAFFLTKA